MCKKIFRKCSNTYNWVYRIQNEVKEERNMYDDLDFDPQRVLEELEKALLGVNTVDSLFILNLGIHFTITIPFSKYQKLIQEVIALVTQTVQDEQNNTIKRFKAHIVWRASAFVYKENILKFTNVFSFLTNQVSGHRFTDINPVSRA